MEKEPMMQNTQEAVQPSFESEKSREEFIATIEEVRELTNILFNEVGGIEGIATSTTPEIQAEFGGLNPEEFIGRIKKAENALGITKAA